MTHPRRGRRKYYDLFAPFYDAFIRMHSRRDEDDTREFLVDASFLEGMPAPRILDVCCGTGSVTLAFGRRYPGAMTVGYDFSGGMLRKAMEKNVTGRVRFVEGDAAFLPFADDSFDAVTCSHALYELKGESRKKTLLEMKRVVRPDGIVLLMEHEVPRHPFVKLFFYIRMLAMGADDAREFVRGGVDSVNKIFPRVSLSHSKTGKSRLMSCRK
jgi:ubiquinone/menaquinone biosynthesis C-methylase UbiE